MATYRTVVTGASSGIGRATALLLAKAGHSLVLNSRREQLLTSLAEACLAAGSPAVAVVAGDVRDQDTGMKAKDALRQMKGEAVLINSAGFAEFGQFTETDIEREIAMVDVMLSGTMRMTREVLPLMLDQGVGTVLNVLSVSATTVFSGAVGYCSAKAGALMFTRVLAKEVRSKGVRVIAVIPGSTDTSIWDEMESHPPRKDMLPASAVAEVICDAIHAPRDRTLDEITVMPPKGIL